MAKKGGGGLGSSLINIFWMLIVIGAALAIFQITSVNSIEETVEKIKAKSVEYSECIPAKECGISTIFDDIKEIVTGNESDGNLLGNSNNNSGNNQSNNPGKTDKDPEIDSNLNEDLNETIKEELNYKGPAKGEPFVNNSGLVSKESSKDLLATLKTVSDKEDKNKDVGYSRKEWKHWTSSRSCWSTRSEVLYRDAVPGTVSLIDKKKNQTDNPEEGCVIGVVKGDGAIETKGSGEWIDPYSGKRIKDPKDIDIDHVIPLSNAARQGGQSWSLEEKEKFANDLDNLLATSAKENRSKGEKGPGKYMPPNKSYHCSYAKTYINLSSKYNLTITESDVKALNKALDSCKK